MKEKVDLTVYVSDDESLPVSDREVRYPINAFLEKTMTRNDELKIILLEKKDEYGHFQKNTEDFKQELNEANKNIGAKLSYIVIDTDFSQSSIVHEQLMGSIVDELEIGNHILADITYGPKDLPIVIFTALNFAEKFLECKVDNIVYGQASFVDGKVVNTKICDMIPLYCLASITNTINCVEPEKAKKMLKSLLSI
jgi:alpha-L-arabinofuranosidase